MQDYQHEFLKFAIDTGALCFGEFKLKSGRMSPYFFNTGLFNSGARLARLGRFYAQSIEAEAVPFDMLYGPAYKGIPLVASIAVAFADRHARDLPYAFNRKEAKHHAEGGIIVGSPLRGRVLIVDDVISAGTSVRESVDIIRAAGAQAVGVAISLDRQERGVGSRSAVGEVQDSFSLKVTSIVTLKLLIDYLTETGEQAQHLAAIRRYQETYGE